jgi:hypothetical protein
MGHDAVLRSLDAALASHGLVSVKLNVVVVKGLNDTEVLDFVEMTKEKPISVRFIEFMPFVCPLVSRCWIYADSLGVDRSVVCRWGSKATHVRNQEMNGIKLRWFHLPNF